MPNVGPLIPPGEEEKGMFRRAVSVGTGSLLKIVDFLNRANYASANLSRDIIQAAQGKDPLEIFGPIVRGLLGKEKTTYGDVLSEDLGWNPTSKLGKVARGVTGFGLDVALDPTTYFGPITAWRKLGRPGSAALRHADDLFLKSPIGKLLSTRAPTEAVAVGAKMKAARTLQSRIGQEGVEQTKKLALEARPVRKMIAAHIEDYIPQSLLKMLDGADPLVRSNILSKMNADTVLSHWTEYSWKHARHEIPEQARPLIKRLVAHADDLEKLQLEAGVKLPLLGRYSELEGVLDAVKVSREEFKLANRAIGKASYTSAVTNRTVVNAELLKTATKAARGAKKKLERAVLKANKEYLTITRKKNQSLTRLLGDIGVTVPKKIANAGDAVGLREGLSLLAEHEIQHVFQAPTSKFSKWVRRYSPRASKLRVHPEIDDFGRHMLNRANYVVPGITGRHATQLEIQTAADLGKLRFRFPGGEARLVERGMKVHEANPFLSNAIHSQEAGRVIAGRMFKDEVITLAKERPKVPTGSFQFRVGGIPKIAKKYWTESEKEIIERTKEMFSPNVVRQVEGTILRLWKRITLLPWPKYHLRNVVSSTFNAGYEHPSLYTPVPYFKFERILSKYLRDGLPALKSADRSLMEELINHNALGRGLFHVHTQRGIKQQLRKAVGAPVEGGLGGKVGAAGNAILDVGGAVGEKIETIVRGAHYMVARRTNRKSVQEALASVAKYQFDYTDLTKAERSIQRIFPFYTWTRKNLPLQVEMLLTKPGRFAAVGKFKTAVEGMQEEPLLTNLLKDYQKSGIPLKIRGGQKQAVYDLADLLPFNELGILSEVVGPHGELQPWKPLELGMNLLSPLYKVPIEQAAGRSLFTGQSIEGRRISHLLESGFRGFGETRRTRTFLGKGEPGLAALYQTIGSARTFEPAKEWATQKNSAKSSVRRYQTLLDQAIRDGDVSNAKKYQALLEKHRTRLREILSRPPGR